MSCLLSLAHFHYSSLRRFRNSTCPFPLLTVAQGLNTIGLYLLTLALSLHGLTLILSYYLRWRRGICFTTRTSGGVEALLTIFFTVRARRLENPAICSQG